MINIMVLHTQTNQLCKLRRGCERLTESYKTKLLTLPKSIPNASLGSPGPQQKHPSNYTSGALPGASLVSAWTLLGLYVGSLLVLLDFLYIILVQDERFFPHWGGTAPSGRFLGLSCRYYYIHHSWWDTAPQLRNCMFLPRCMLGLLGKARVFFRRRFHSSRILITHPNRVSKNYWYYY